MFVDENGVVADIAFIPSSTSNRMNIGRSHEHTIGAAGRDCIKDIRTLLGLHETKVYEEDFIDYTLEKLPITVKEQAFEYLLGAYKILSPTVIYPVMTEAYENRLKDNWWLDHLIQVIYDGNEPYGLYLQNPVGCGIKYDEVIRDLYAGPYAPRETPLTYRDLGGKMRTTKAPILIGPTYLLALEKTATDYNGVSVSRVNQFGTSAKLTNADKYSAPVREVGTNHSGEAEVRNMAKSVGGEVMAALADMNNDPATVKQVAVNLLTADRPTDIECILDPELYRGSHRARDFALNHMYTSGKEFIRPDEREDDCKSTGR